MKTMCRDIGKMLDGIEAMESLFGNVLSMAHGTSFTDLQSGSFVSDYYDKYANSAWLSRFIMMEIIRLSFVPRYSRSANKKVAALPWVKRVNSVSAPTFELAEQRLSVHVDAELEGVAHWSGVLPVFICTPEQLMEDRDRAKQHALVTSPTADLGLVESVPVDKKIAERLKLLWR